MKAAPSQFAEIVLLVVVMLSAASLNMAQNAKPKPAPQSEPQQESRVDDEKVYASSEVDVKAKIKNQMENLPELRWDCPDAATIRFKATLHKSGKVKDVVLIKGVGCSYDKQVIAAVRKYKFTPAMKDGRAVSQYTEIEYKSERILRRHRTDW